MNTFRSTICIAPYTTPDVPRAATGGSNGGGGDDGGVQLGV